jgi:hypothetical protein
MKQNELHDYTVYCLCSGRSVRYIGLTRQRLSKRIAIHFRDARQGKRNNPICAWIRDNPNMKIVPLKTGLTCKEAVYLEIKLIGFLTKPFNLLNVMKGGQVGNARVETRHDRIIRKCAAMRAAKERKRLERGHVEAPPKPEPFYRYTVTVTDTLTGESGTVPLKSIRDITKRLSLVLKHV